MSKPAARMGDMTAHGGTIAMGFPQVLIGGLPAARITDMHVCPLVTGVVPHVGGPIAMGSVGVLIGGLPAARMGDLATCVGPPDMIAMGCMNVLIGEVAAGSASGGGMSAGAAAGAAASAALAMLDNLDTTTLEEHWVAFRFQDKAGLPVSGIPYKMVDADGVESEALLRLDGRVVRDALSEGNSSVTLRGIRGAKWAKTTAKIGDKVNLSANFDGFENGEEATVQIFKRDLTGPDVLVESIASKVQSGKVEAEWMFVLPEVDDEVLVGFESGDTHATSGNYSAPEFYFEVIAGLSKTRSGLLYLEDFIEVEMKDDDGTALANEEYVLYMPNGEVRTGQLDANGKLKEEHIPAGFCQIKFPNLPDIEADV